MAKFRIEFISESEDSYAYIETRIFKNEPDAIVINIKDDTDSMARCVWFDKSTAIKFAKTLRTEINKIES